MKTLKDKFNFEHSFKQTIDSAIQGLQNKFDAHIMSDLKRMSELGVLDIESSQPEYIPIATVDGRIKIEQKVRLRFKGEAEIEARKENEQYLYTLLVKYMHLVHGEEGVTFLHYADRPQDNRSKIEFTEKELNHLKEIEAKLEAL